MQVSEHHKIRGMTLIEVMLVLAIIATLVAMSLGTFQRYRIEEEFNQLKYDVEVLFQGLRIYYQANCRDGDLSPITHPTLDLTAPKDVDIASLSSKGYLPTTWPTTNAIVNDESFYKGYSAQFNPRVLPPRSMSACYQFNGPGPNRTCARDTIASSKPLLWQLQVAVVVNNVKNAQDYTSYVGASCAIEKFTNTVVNCSTEASPNGQILIFQRAPSLVNQNISSGLWQWTPKIKAFNLLYTHDPMYEMYNPDAGSDYQYYLCGG